jgi:hypothetical protein
VKVDEDVAVLRGDERGDDTMGLKELGAVVVPSDALKKQGNRAMGCCGTNYQICLKQSKHNYQKKSERHLWHVMVDQRSDWGREAQTLQISQQEIIAHLKEEV